MKLIELKEVLEATGYPVAYSHFTESDQTPLPEPPYICYLVAFTPNYMADNQTFTTIEHIQIELYTVKKDESAENNLETILKENDLPYSSVERYIDSENLYQKIYETRLL